MIKIDEMKTLGILAVCMFAVGMAVALPTDSELAKAETEVRAIVQDVATREKGDRGKIAESLVSLEAEAGSAAAKFLFRREAILRFLQSGKCERARDVLKRFVDEGDPSSALAADEQVNRQLLRKEKKALKSNSEYKSYATFAREISSTQRERVEVENRLKGLEQAYAKNPENARNRNMLAMEYAIRGDWAKAVPLFAKAKGSIGEAAQAEVAKPEAKGKDAVAIADGWWNVVGKNYPPSLTQACRRHAVEWYRTALADETLPNLVKLRIGARIEEIESQGGGETTTVPEKDESANSGFPAVNVKGGELVRVPLDTKGDVVMELSACPPGEFTMGEGKEWHDRAHKVKLTYPYLIGRTHVTFGMVKTVDRKVWKTRMDAIRSDDEKFYRDDSAFDGVTDTDAASFLKKLNALASKCRELRPYKGYEFRLPTEAEWVHAYQAGTNEEMEGITDDELKKYWGKLGNSNWRSLPFEHDVINVLEKKPNAWGLSNMVQGSEDLADLIPLPKLKNGNRAYHLPEADRDFFTYADFEENPIRICTDKTACHVSRAGKSNKKTRAVMKVSHPQGKYLGGETPCRVFRLVYGPKLDKLNVYPKKEVAEKK